MKPGALGVRLTIFRYFYQFCKLVIIIYSSKVINEPKSFMKYALEDPV